jgi:hypothetical protein
MPYSDAGDLTAKQVYPVTAYILFMNGIVGERDELNKVSLPKVSLWHCGQTVLLAASAGRRPKTPYKPMATQTTLMDADGYAPFQPLLMIKPAPDRMFSQW